MGNRIARSQHAAQRFKHSAHTGTHTCQGASFVDAEAECDEEEEEYEEGEDEVSSQDLAFVDDLASEDLS
eukprot:4316471-Prymnesium_polylepis.1